MPRNESGDNCLELTVGINSCPSVKKGGACPQLAAACGTQFAGRGAIDRIVEFLHLVILCVVGIGQAAGQQADPQD